MVYDFGGGTFDCTLLQRQELPSITRLKVVATKGDPFLGGEDIDEKIVEHFVTRSESAFTDLQDAEKAQEIPESAKKSHVIKEKIRQIARDVKESIQKQTSNRFL